MASCERLHFTKLPLADIGEVPGTSGCVLHRGAHQVGSAAPALPPFKIAIAGRGATLTRSENVRIHAQTHGAAGLAPIETGCAKNLIQSFCFRLLLHLL